MAASDSDIAVVGVSVTNGKINATLYNYNYKDSGTVSKISYYVDGKNVETQTDTKTIASLKKTSFTSETTVDTSNKHSFTVVISVDGDTNVSNNNATKVFKPGQSTTEPDTTEPPTTEAPTTTPSTTESELTIVSIEQPSISDMTIGATYQIKARVKNSSSLATSGEVNFYVDDTLVGTVQVSNLAAGAEQDVTFDWTVTHGNHTFKATAVADGKENSQSCYVQTINLSSESGQADLIVTDIIFNPSSPKVGESVVFTAVVKNNGTATTTVNSGKDSIIGVRFGINSVDGTPFTWCDNFKDKPLGPGQSVYLTANGGSNGESWTPSSEATYTIHAWVDDQARISESNTGNNTYSESIAVSSQPPITIPDGEVSDGTVKAFSVPTGKSQAAGIAMTANNEAVGIFNTTVNNSRYWDTLIYQDTPVAIFEFDGKVKVRVALSKTVTSAVVRPLSAGVTPTISTTSDGISIVEFELSKQGGYSVEFNGSSEGALQLMANPITEEPTGNVIKVSSGSSYGAVTVGSGQTLYIEGGAAVYGRVTLQSGAKVVGSGIIEAGGAWGNISVNITGASNVEINNVTVVNAPSWITEVRDSSYVTFNHFNIIAAAKNSDGISIQSSNHIYINNCYIRTWDDCIVLKNYSAGNYTNNVYVDGCVLWPDLAQAMELGAETNKGAGSNPTIHTVEFKNIDVIHDFHKPALSIHNCDNAAIYDVKWSNVTIEDAQMGKNSRVNEDGWPIFLDLTNVKGGEVDGTAESWTTVAARGSISNVTFENIKVLTWDNDIGKAPGIRLLNSSAGGTISGVTIKGLQVGDKTIGSVDEARNVMNVEIGSNASLTIE